MELVGQDLTNLPLGLSLPRTKLPIFTYQGEQPPQQQQQQQLHQPQVSLQQNTSAPQCSQYLPSTTQQLYATQAVPTGSLLEAGSQYAQPQHQPYQQPQPQPQGGGTLSEDDSGYDLMDDSLTDMQWLQRMDAGGVPGIAKGGRKRGTSRAADKENKKSAKDGSCRKKLEYPSSKKSSNSNKPPLSYASLIALAICSTPQRMMTLSGIYRWIENTFPFYRTPEAKAWKNSIRHNLSIRKNMFMKVYQYPPRRGNGSYWTLLSDGEEELKRAVPLFSTFRPPVIDPECIYSRGAASNTHTVKSKGQFIPLLPRSGLTPTNQAYFSVDGTLSIAARVQQPEEESVTTKVVLDSANLEYDGICGDNSSILPSENLPAHILEHSYAKLSHVPADGLLDSSSESDKENEGCPPTPKRKKATGRKPSTPSRLPSSKVSGVSRPGKGQEKGDLHSEAKELEANTSDDDSDDEAFRTPPKEQDSSLHLLDSSFLTPLRNLDPGIEIGPISLSPLYTNFVTPKRGTTATSHASSSSAKPTSDSTISPEAPTHNKVSPTAPSLSVTGMAAIPGSSNLLATSINTIPLPLTPLRNFTNTLGGGVGSFDSGIFSPLSSDTFNVKFSTPILSPLTDLLQPNTFSTPHPPEFLTPLKVLDSTHGSENTPLRVGSLGALGLPGFTPPAAAVKTRR